MDAAVSGSRSSSAPALRRNERICARLSSSGFGVTVARLSALLQLRHDAADGLLRIAEQHSGLWVEVQIVVDAREAGLHRALDDDDVLRLVDVEDRHAVDGRALV